MGLPQGYPEGQPQSEHYRGRAEAAAAVGEDEDEAQQGEQPEQCQQHGGLPKVDRKKCGR